MYIQITDHCNMTCAHCCYSCSPRKRNFMSKDVFVKALDLYDLDYISIGGGEPTLHPLFWDFIGISLSRVDSVWLATNGSQTQTALALARLTKKEILSCELSRDYYHSEIDDRVVSAFTAIKSIRNVSKHVVKKGRAVRTHTWINDGCCCEDILVDPNGLIWSCGCKKLILGDVYNGFNDKYDKLNSEQDYLDYSYGDCLFTRTKKSEVREIIQWLES